MKKNICWEHDKKAVRRSARRPKTGSWYDCLLLFCGACLCVLSFCLQMYGLLNGIDGLALPEHTVLYIVGALAALSVCYGCGVLKRIWMRLLPVFVIAAAFLRYYLTHRLATEDGILYVLRMYVAKISIYYQRVIMFPVGIREEAPAALLFFLLAIVIGIFMLGAVLQRGELLLLLPVAALCSGLAVGEAPDWKSMLLLFAGAMLLRMYEQSKGERVRVRAAQLAGILCVCLVFGAVCSVFADDVVAGHEKTMERQLALEDAVLALPIGDLFAQDGTVTNDAPLGNGKEVLTITLSDEPTENVYLKTYAADHYENGKWSSNEEAFVQAAAAQDLTPRQAGEFVWNMSLEEGQSVLAPEDAHGAVGYFAVAAPKEFDYTINCRNFGKAAPLPYVSRLSEEFASKADTAAEKPWTTRNYSGSLVLGGRKADPLIDYLGTYYMTQNWPEQMTSISSLKKKAKESWYSNFVWEQCAETASYEPVRQWLDDYLVQIGWAGTDEFREYFSDLHEHSVPAMTNATRLSYAVLVQSFLQYSGTYSRKLDALPGGTDPIDYFLNTSGEGYCVHFASAAALMLQTMGIPARYASGYVVFQNDFEKAEEGYTAVETDTRAHAWVEVYLDQFGWIPLEVTPGFSDGDVSGGGKADTDKGANSGQTKSDNKKTDTGSQEEPEPGLDEPDHLKENEKNEVKQEQEGSEGLLDTIVCGRTLIWWLSVLGALLLAYFVICLMIDGIRMYQRKQEQIIRREMAEGHNREAILRINRRMYRMLSARELLLGRRIRDDGRFRRALGWFSAYRQAAVDVEQYMKLVRQAYFSEDEMCAADAQLVFGIYQRCRMKRSVRLKIANSAYRQTEE